MDVAYELTDDGSMHLQSSLVDTLRDAQRRQAEGTSLATLIPIESAPADQE